MNRHPKVCILLATYNGARFLGALLDSLFAQTYQQIRVIAHDDNSDDATVEILAAYGSRYPEKIFLLEDTFAAGSAAKNFAYLAAYADAECDYVMFCDQDDVWLPTKIEATLAKMQEAEKDGPPVPLLVYTDASIVAEDLQTTAASLYASRRQDRRTAADIRALAIENHILGCTVMINRPLAALVRSMPEEAVMHDWWAALMALKHGGRIVFLDEPTLLYRQHGNNVLGAPEINARHFFAKLLRIGAYAAALRAVIRQMHKAGIVMPWYEIAGRKTMMILRRVFRAGL